MSPFWLICIPCEPTTLARTTSLFNLQICVAFRFANGRPGKLHQTQPPPPLWQHQNMCQQWGKFAKKSGSWRPKIESRSEKISPYLGGFHLQWKNFAGGGVACRTANLKLWNSKTASALLGRDFLSSLTPSGKLSNWNGTLLHVEVKTNINSQTSGGAPAQKLGLFLLIKHSKKKQDTVFLLKIFSMCVCGYRPLQYFLVSASFSFILSVVKEPMLLPGLCFKTCSDYWQILKGLLYIRTFNFTIFAFADLCTWTYT